MAFFISNIYDFITLNIKQNFSKDLLTKIFKASMSKNTPNAVFQNSLKSIKFVV